MSKIKDISIIIPQTEIYPGQSVHGTININYAGRFDSIVINTQIENSNDIFNFTHLNGKKINQPYARVSVLKEDIGNQKTLDFVANTKHIPLGGYSNVKFRATIIQEHKEVSSDVMYIKITK
jgi:hypothetical protein